MHFSSNDGSQNTFVYQAIIDTLEWIKDKDTDYVLSWKSKGVYSSKLKPLYTAFLRSIKLSEYRMGIKFDIVNCKCLYCLWFRCLIKKSY